MINKHNKTRKMKKQIVITLILISVGMLNLNAQVSGNYQYNNTPAVQSFDRTPASKAAIFNNNELDVTVNGLMNIVADNYVAVFNIVQVGGTADSTNQIMNRRILNFQKALSLLGIDASDIRTDMISFVPKYDIQTEDKVFSKTYNEVPAGYELQKNITVHYKSSAKLDDIVSAAANCEIYDLVKVDYFISNTQKAMDSLRIKCMLELKSKLKSYELIGFRFDTLKKDISDNFTTTYPQTRYYSYQAFSKPSLNSVKKKSSAVVTEAPKITSRYYNHIDYDQYDLIINPVVTEPVVQLSYTVTVKYFIKPEAKLNNTYYILTPSGETKQFYPK